VRSSDHKAYLLYSLGPLFGVAQRTPERTHMEPHKEPNLAQYSSVTGGCQPESERRFSPFVVGLLASLDPPVTDAWTKKTTECNGVGRGSGWEKRRATPIGAALNAVIAWRLRDGGAQIAKSRVATT
jgi:hypothetical protein